MVFRWRTPSENYTCQGQSGVGENPWGVGSENENGEPPPPHFRFIKRCFAGHLVREVHSGGSFTEFVFAGENGQPPIRLTTRWVPSNQTPEPIHIREGEQKEFGASELYGHYKDWCRDSRINAMTLRKFGIEIKKILGEPVHTMKGNIYAF